MITAFQASVYILASLASLLLAFAEENPLATFTVPLACLSFFFTERMRILRLSKTWAFRLGVIAFMVAGFELLESVAEMRLRSGGHLAVYLTWVVMLQQKGARQYWFMCALGVLQVALASILTIEGAFGVFMLFYMMLGVWTLSMFALVRQTRSVEGAMASSSADDQSLFLDEIQTVRLQSNRNPADESLARVSSFAGTLPNMTRGAIQRDSGTRTIGGRLVFGLMAACFLSMVMGVLFFLFIPRFWYLRWSPGTHRPSLAETLTGFTEEVQLGDMGEILESNERVLEVEVFDNDSGEKIDLEQYARMLGQEEPLFRGAVLGLYNSGRWRPIGRDGLSGVFLREPKPNMIRQDIRMQPIGASFLFAVHPTELCLLDHQNPDVKIHQFTSALERDRRVSSNAPVSYKAYAFRQRPTTEPPLGAIDFVRESRTRRRVLGTYRQLPNAGLDRLVDLARQTATPTPGTQPAALEMAQNIVAFLRDSGQFSYTLNAAIDDPSVDPVVDFLFNRKAGHCEYYASALALMLRAVNIPSRLVSGFKGAEKNEISGDYVVQQRHAHTWVEAFIDNKWIVLDATPAARAESVASFQGGMSLFHELQHVLSRIWFRQVVDMSLSKQRTHVYEPLQEWASETLYSILAPRSSNANASQENSSTHKIGIWRNSVLILVSVLGLVVLTITVRLLRGGKPLQWFERFRSLSGIRGKTITRVEFYERFQKILAGHGFVRATGQTQREFARSVGHSVQDRLGAHQLSHFPNDLVEQFYGVRFGSQSLSADETRQINQTLEQLQLCLSRAKAGASSLRETNS